MFPLHREFVNYKQLQAAMKLFCTHWNFVVKHVSKQFSCSYCTVPKRNTIDIVGNENTTKERRTTQAAKHGKVICPFRINYTLVNYKFPKSDEIFYKVRISNIVSLEHKCMMNVSSYRIAYKSSKSHKKIHLQTFNTVIEHLRVNPSLPAKQLRPLLSSALPSHTDINSKFIDNFRSRVYIHIANNPNSNQISYE